MAIFYGRSTDGSNSDNGTTWALAKATISGFPALNGAAGSTYYLSQVHSESSSFINSSWNVLGTLANPQYVVGANDAAQPPTAYSTAPVVATNDVGTGLLGLYWGGAAVWLGITFRAGVNNSNNVQIDLNQSGWDTYIYFQDCNFQNEGTGSTPRISAQGSDIFVNCTFRGQAAGMVIEVGVMKMRGCSIAAGGVSPSTVFKTNLGAGGRFEIEGFDFSNCSSTVNIFDPNTTSMPIVGVFSHCKFPASWSGSFVTNTAGMNTLTVIDFINCSKDAVNYQSYRQAYAGTIRHETTVVMTGGASDESQALAWKMVSSSAASYPMFPLITQDLSKWNGAVGSPITATVEIVTDNVTLKDDECYLEVIYLSSSGTPLGTRVADCKADVLTTAANQDSSSVTWTTTGLSTPVKQKLSVTFTPQMAGYVYGRVMLHKASTTVYVNPQLILS